MIHSKCHHVPFKTVENLVRVFGGADLINALVEADIRTVNLPETKLTALIIPVPDLERFNPKPPFGNITAHTWGLVHGTTVTAATAILIEGLIRPADWEHSDDPKRSQPFQHGPRNQPWRHRASSLGRRKEKANNQSSLGLCTVAPNNTWQ